MTEINNILISEMQKKREFHFLLIILKHNKKATLYKNELYWFNTGEDYVHEFAASEQEYSSRFCKDKREAYAYGFDIIKNAQMKCPNISIKIIELS
jgi:hypothetical protein